MRILALLLLLSLYSCKSENASQVANNQGIFEFPDELNFSSSGEMPRYLDPDKVLCHGRGFKVARCISNQLEKGICLGVIKEGKEVYVVEIDCDNVKEEEE